MKEYTFSHHAQATGNAEVLLAGSDPVLLVQEYAARAEHTLQFMASNLVAKAHRIVWARYANTIPARVISVISAQCAQAASLEDTVGQKAEHGRLMQPSRDDAPSNRMVRSPA